MTTTRHCDDLPRRCHPELVSGSLLIKVGLSMKKYFVYIVSNFNRNVFYIGVTNNIERRTLEHKGGIGSEFTRKYNCHYLLYFEEFGNINTAIEREKQLKNWHREWKINLIKSQNKDMKDLAVDWFTDYDIKNVKEMQ